MCAWSLRLWRLTVLPYFLLLLLPTRMFVNSSPESPGSRDAPRAPDPSGDQGPAWLAAHGDSGGTCTGRAPLLLASSSSSTAAVTATESPSSTAGAAAVMRESASSTSSASSATAAVTSAAATAEESSPSSITTAVPPVTESGEGPSPVSTSDSLSSSSSAAGYESSSSPPPRSSLGHSFSSIPDLSPMRPRRLRAVDAPWYGQGTGFGSVPAAGPGSAVRPRKMFGWGDFSASVRTARLQVLITAKMVDHGNGSVSVHFRHNATGRGGSVSVSLGPPATPLRFAPPRGPLASQQTRPPQWNENHQQEQQGERRQKRQHQHYRDYRQQRWRRHENLLQQEQNEQPHQHLEQQEHHRRRYHHHHHQRYQSDATHQQEEHHQNQQQEQQRSHQGDRGQHQQPQPQQQQRPQEQHQAESKESRDPGTFRCRVEYEKVDRALKSAPCVEPRAAGPAGSSPDPGGLGHGSPDAGPGSGGSCYREQVQSHVSWICSKPFSAFCIYIAFQGTDYRLAHKVCPDLHPARTHPSG